MHIKPQQYRLSDGKTILHTLAICDKHAILIAKLTKATSVKRVINTTRVKGQLQTNYAVVL